MLMPSLLSRLDFQLEIFRSHKPDLLPYFYLSGCLSFYLFFVHLFHLSSFFISSYLSFLLSVIFPLSPRSFHNHSLLINAHLILLTYLTAAGTSNYSRRIEMEPCCEGCEGMGSYIIEGLLWPLLAPFLPPTLLPFVHFHAIFFSIFSPILHQYFFSLAPLAYCSIFNFIFSFLFFYFQTSFSFYCLFTCFYLFMLPLVHLPISYTLPMNCKFSSE